MNREQQINQEINQLAAERIMIRQRKQWTCPLCNKRTIISSLKIIEENFYVSPSGCMEGDYWLGANEYYIRCPKCTNITRVMNDCIQIQPHRTIHTTINGSKPYELIKKYRGSFNETIQWYPRNEYMSDEKFEHLIAHSHHGEN